MTERQALDAAVKRAVSSAPFVRSISAALADVLTPADGSNVLPPVCVQTRRVEFDSDANRYEISDGAGYHLHAHKSSHPEMLGLWLARLQKVDGEGIAWSRTFELMVMDDFGNLVEVR